MQTGKSQSASKAAQSDEGDCNPGFAILNIYYVQYPMILSVDREGTDETVQMHTSEPCLFVLRFYGPVNPMGSCRAWSVYLTTHLLGRLSPLSC